MMKAVLKKNDFEILDSIRGIAALYVTISHCRGTLWIGGGEFVKMFPMESWTWWDYAIFGTSMMTRLAVEFVIVFFVLSGFSIAHSLSENKAAGKFYFRRLIRIYPSYLVALVWAGVVLLITQSMHPEWYTIHEGRFFLHRTVEMKNYFDWDIVLENLFYMPNGGFIAPFWSLTYEVIFYLLAPFLLRKPIIYAIISGLLFLLKQLAPSIVESLNLPVYIHEFIFTYNVYFAIGVTLYNVYPRVKEILLGFGKDQLKIFMVVVLAMMLFSNLYFQIETTYSFLLSAVLSCLLIFYFINYQVSIRWLMNIGKFSYTLYITHYTSIFLYLAFYFTIFNPKEIYILNYFVWIPAVFFCLVIAWLQYLFVEKRTKSILNILRRKNKGAVPVLVKN